MNALNFIKYWIIFLFFTDCHSQDLMKYDNSIVSIKKLYKTEKINLNNDDFSSLNEELNLNLMESKVRISRIFKIPIQSVEDIDVHHYIYGYKPLNDFKVFLYSNEYNPSQQTTNSFLYSSIEGFLILMKKKKILGYIKVFYDEPDSNIFLKSFFIDNYIISVQIIDNEYDIQKINENNEIVEKPAKYSYSVFEIQKQGKIILLKEKFAKKIAQKYLVNYDEFRDKL